MPLFSIKYYTLATFQDLEKDWSLLQDGVDMTYFQQYAWNKMLAALPWSNNYHYEVVFAEIKESSRPLLIAPLLVIKDYRYRNYPQGYYFFGDQGWSDYCNLIYKDFDVDAVEFLFSSLKAHFGVGRINLSNLKEDTALYEYLVKTRKVIKDDVTVCVSLDFPSSVEEYNQLLSKSARQNIRTARNRASKDGLSLVYNYDERDTDIQEFLFYNQRRAEERDRKAVKTLSRGGGIIALHVLAQFFRSLYHKLTDFKAPEYTPFEDDVNSHFMTVRNAENGELMAGINYGISTNRDEIVVMAVSLNEKYKRYSPGMLILYDYITAQIQKQELHTIDFTRGQENYKYVLGGAAHNNHSISMEI